LQIRKVRSSSESTERKKDTELKKSATVNDSEKNKVASLTARKLPAFEKESSNKNQSETKREVKTLSQEIIEQ
jgi:hypothetical protein